MQEIALNDDVINAVKVESVRMVCSFMQNDLVEIVIYCSCARGDYTKDSDIDIALLTRSSRLKSKKYNEELAEIATELAIKYFAIVNFICLPYEEFEEKKLWYPYFMNIASDGEILYRQGI